MTGLAIEEIGPVLSMLTELQIAHRESSDSLSEQRIDGIKTYVVAIAVLTAYAITQAAKDGVRWYYLSLLSLSTVVVLLFQGYWSYYTFFETRMAHKYQNELTEFIEMANKPDAKLVDVWPLRGSKCHVDKVLREEPIDWRPRKASEVNNNWRHYLTFVDSEGNVVGPDSNIERFGPCDVAFKDWRILLSARQLNMWTASIFLFSMAAGIGALRFLKR